MQQPWLLLEGKYEILSKIREGGMGTIYRVRHRLLDEIRVVKVMQPHVVADGDLKRRFLEEAKTAIRLKHPNICTLHDYAVDEDGTAYLVMEFIDGVNLADFLKSRGLPGVPLTLEIAHQALLALGYLHRKGVIHRDIAPDNLMLAHDEEGRAVVKLIDLGIAKAVNRAMDLTATGVFLGKLKYASPEQFGTLPANEKLDGRSDLYGLGVVLYELLTGIRPFQGESPAELLRAHLFTEPIPFSESDKEGKVPPELRAAVFKALEKKRENRYAAAEEFDREVVGLRDRFAGPDDLANTMAILSTIRSTQPLAPESVTPSAQDRLDRQFGPITTPSPSSTPLTISPTPVAPAPPPPPAEPHEEKRTQAIGPPPVRPTERDRETEPGERRTTAPITEEAGPAERTAINPVLAAERASADAEEKASTRGLPAPPREPARKPVEPVRPHDTPGAAPTPWPAESKKRAAGRPEPQLLPPLPVPAARPLPKPAVEPAPAARPEQVRLQPQAWGLRRPAWWIALAFAGTAVLFVWRPWAHRRSPAEETVAGPTAAATPVAQEAEPTAPPAPSPFPSAVPTAAPTARPATPAPQPSRQAMEEARTELRRARQAADQADARNLSPSTYRRAAARQTEAEKLATRGEDGEATNRFEAATRLFALAERSALAQPRRTPVQVAQLPTVLVRPTSSFVVPTAVPVPPTAAPQPTSRPLEVTRVAPDEKLTSPPPAPPAGADTAETEKILDVLRNYEFAWNSRDADLYAKVFPSGLEAFRQAFRKSAERQAVRIDRPRVSLASPTSATVIAIETIVFTPRAGTEQRDTHSVTLNLEKTGDRWVITSRK